MNNEEMLARLLAQVDAAPGELVTLRAIVEEASELGAARALAWTMTWPMATCRNCASCCVPGAMPRPAPGARRWTGWCVGFSPCCSSAWPCALA